MQRVGARVAVPVDEETGVGRQRDLRGVQGDQVRGERPGGTQRRRDAERRGEQASAAPSPSARCAGLDPAVPDMPSALWCRLQFLTSVAQRVSAPVVVLVEFTSADEPG